MQKQARALGDPTRHRIFRYLADSEDAVSVEDLTTHMRLNHNAIRQHLTKLIDAGLVVRATAAARGRGRPRLEFSVHPSVDDRWGAGGPYQRLSMMLIEMLRSGDSAVEVGRRAGEEIELRTDRRGRAVEQLGDAITGGGFDPVLMSDEPAEFVLRHCPFADTASADPATICALHLGLAQGLAGQLEGVVVEELVPRNPRQAGCRLRFRVEGNDTAA